MNEERFCSQCGTPLRAEDRFCGGCGYNFNNEPAGTSIPAPIPAPIPPPLAHPIGINKNRHNTQLIIVISLAAVLFLAGGGGLYWWFSSSSRHNNLVTKAQQDAMAVVPIEPIEPFVGGVMPEATEIPEALEVPADPEPAEVPVAGVDLSRAATYLSSNGLKCTFVVNYVDGDTGMVDRISGKSNRDGSVEISEAEIATADGEEYGFATHYIEEADGTYYVTDSLYDDPFPVLKNDLTIGRTWDYSDDYGSIIWTVLDLGVELDLGFNKFTNCLVVEEDNQAADFKSVIYYSPGHGSIYVTSPNGATEFYKMTAMSKIDEVEAQNIISKWRSN